MSITVARTTPVETGVRCPFPGCEHVWTLADSQEWGACPQCRRIAVRCTNRPSGVERCPAMNRPLARFCRRCQVTLPTDLFAQACEADFAESPTEVLFPLAVMRHAKNAEHGGEYRTERLVQLDGYIPTGSGRAGACLAVVPGLLAVGLPGGRFLLFDPFSPNTPPRLDRKLTAESGELVRVTADGGFVAAYTDRELLVDSLLAVDASSSTPSPPMLQWAAPTGRRLAGRPVFLPAKLEPTPLPQDRLLAWLSWGPDHGLLLHWVPLPTTAAPLEPASWKVPSESPSPGSGLVVVCADPPVLGIPTADALFLVGLPLAGKAGTNGDKKSPTPAHAKIALPPNTLANGTGDIPRIAFLPEPQRPGGAGTRLLGRLAAATATDDPDLLLLAVTNPVPSSPTIHTEVGAGYPLAAIRSQAQGEDQVLCVNGGQVLLVNRLHQRTTVCEDRDLGGLYRGDVYGRIAVLVGRSAGQANSWFTLLVDLVEMRVVDRETHRTRPAYSTLLGRYWFTTEMQGNELWLIRRELARVG